MSSTLVFVVGLQKSGTTLMTRLLQQTGLVTSPWKGEGHDFWGDVPPFSPAAHPSGTVYQRHCGNLGHEVGAGDAQPEIRALLLRRLRALRESDTPFIVNKNPYNVARLPWIRELFPHARIVAMVRRPVPNVFSLLKKYDTTMERPIPPEEGWWGVKPAGWNTHAFDEVVERCAWQWSAINRKLDQDRDCVDCVVAYHSLCQGPTEFVERVLGRALTEPLAPVRCFDDEHRSGAELLSKNRHFWRTKSLAVPHSEPIELAPLDPKAVAAIERLCGGTSARFPELG